MTTVTEAKLIPCDLYKAQTECFLSEMQMKSIADAYWHILYAQNAREKIRQYSDNPNGYTKEDIQDLAATVQDMVQQAIINTGLEEDVWQQAIEELDKIHRTQEETK